MPSIRMEQVLVVVGICVRLLLAWTGIGRFLAWRIEISTASNSNLELREGLALYGLGVSPYSGSSCRTPPLALWMYGTWAEHGLLYVLPNTVFDVLAALMLYRLAADLTRRTATSGASIEAPKPGGSPCSGDRGITGCSSRVASGPASALPALLAAAYLLNPLSLLASAAGTTAPLEGLAVVAALYGSVVRRPALAAAGLAAAGYMSPHSLVLLLPVACLLEYGPEYGTVAPRLLGGNSDGPSATPPKRQHKPELGQAEAEDEGRPCGAQAQNSAEGGAAAAVTAAEPRNAAGASGIAAPPPPSPQPQPQPPAPGLLPWRALGRCGGLLLGWLLLVALLSDLYLLPLQTRLRNQETHGVHGGAADTEAPPTCLLTAADRLLLSPPWPPLSSLLYAPGEGAEAPGGVARLAAAARGVAAEARARLEATRGSVGSCWAVRVYGSQILLDDVTPNVGQWWYLAMEVFDDAKAYMRLLAHSLLLALAPPLAMRLGPRRPLAAFLLQLLALALLKPYPSVADLGLATSLLPLLLPMLSQPAVAAAAEPPPPAPQSAPPPSAAAAAEPPLAADPAGRPPVSGLLLPASLALLCVLGPSMLRMWLSYESANSNFFYSATLLYGAVQVVMVGQLMGWVIRSDRAARGKALRPAA